MQTLTFQIIIVQITSHTWEWSIRAGDEVLAGGYCRTKRDAMNDAGKVFSKLELN